MMIRKAIMSGIAVAVLATGVTVTPTQVKAQAKYPYQCDVPPEKYPPILAYQQKGKNLPAMLMFRRLVQIYDGKYVKAGCEAFLRGESWDDSCQNGKRPLEEIAKQIPDGFYELGPAEAAKIYQPFVEDKSHTEGYAFCRANGFYNAFKGLAD